VDALGSTTLGNDAPENVDDLGRFEAVSDLEREALAAIGIDYGQEGNLRPVSEHIVDEIHRPTLVWRGSFGHVFPHDRGTPAARHFRPDRKAFFEVNTRNAFDVDQPSFPSQQNVNAALAIADARSCHLFDAQSKNRIDVAPDGSIANRSPIHGQDRAGSPLAQMPGLSDMREHRTTAHPAYHFF
jgi:hypothetical protein